MENPLSTVETNNKKEQRQTLETVFDPQNCQTNLGKGEQKTPQNGEFILDTGDYELKGEGDPYIETIDAGVIDHHRIDNLFRLKGIDLVPKCSAKIVADYSEHILRQIKERKITKTATHFDGDLDSIVSSYLIHSLIQKNKLPLSAQTIATHTNKVDYGMFRENDPQKYLHSLSGFFASIKSTLNSERDQELVKEVFGNQAMKDATGRLTTEGIQTLNNIKTKYEVLFTQKMFELLNLIEKETVANSSFDPEKEMNKLDLPIDLQEIVKKGQENLKIGLEKFNTDFEKVESITVKIQVPNSEKTVTVPMIIALEPESSPLTFTNLAYQKTSPETIIAVFGGPKRKGGDSYNIGITPESASIIDMGAICVALNRAEKVKRDELPNDDEIIKNLQTQPDRLGMSGPEQILTKDPTVLVAGGTLIAASRNSLLSAKEFLQVLKGFENEK